MSDYAKVEYAKFDVLMRTTCPYCGFVAEHEPNPDDVYCQIECLMDVECPKCGKKYHVSCFYEIADGFAVRCRDCAYSIHFFHHDDERWQCTEPHQEGDDVKPDAYCWWGKRKEGGE